MGISQRQGRIKRIRGLIVLFYTYRLIGLNHRISNPVFRVRVSVGVLKKINRRVLKCKQKQ